ncbi:MAG: hypothetical protein ACTS5F_01775 [Candidatus Hodgkinia cicadicola]
MYLPSRSALFIINRRGTFPFAYLLRLLMPSSSVVCLISLTFAPVWNFLRRERWECADKFVRLLHSFI